MRLCNAEAGALQTLVYKNDPRRYFHTHGVAAVVRVDACSEPSTYCRFLSPSMKFEACFTACKQSLVLILLFA